MTLCSKDSHIKTLLNIIMEDKCTFGDFCMGNGLRKEPGVKLIQDFEEYISILCTILDGRRLCHIARWLSNSIKFNNNIVHYYHDIIPQLLGGPFDNEKFTKFIEENIATNFKTVLWLAQFHFLEEDDDLPKVQIGSNNMFTLQFKKGGVLHNFGTFSTNAFFKKFSKYLRKALGSKKPSNQSLIEKPRKKHERFEKNFYQEKPNDQT